MPQAAWSAVCQTVRRGEQMSTLNDDRGARWFGDAARSRARGDHDRGAVIVEFALTLPILVMLLLGIFTGGFAYNQKLAIANGVREASRFGATLPITNSQCPSNPGTNGTTACWLKQVADAAQSGAEGELTVSATPPPVCVAFVDSDGTGTKMTRSGTVDSATVSGTCFNDGISAQKRVQVVGSIQGSIEFMVGTIHPTLQSQAVTRYEGP
jgi:Flp pilus assembly protein TadG